MSWQNEMIYLRMEDGPLRELLLELDQALDVLSECSMPSRGHMMVNVLKGLLDEYIGGLAK